MLKLLSLIFVFATTLYSAELSVAPDWDEVKRKISASEISEKDKVIEAIDTISSSAKAPQIYACFQQISNLSILASALIAVGEVPEKKALKEARVWKFLGRISDSEIQAKAQIAIDEALTSDRLSTARAWGYLADIENELIRGRAAKAVKEKRLQKKPALAWVCMNLSACIEEYTVLNSALSAVIAAPESDALTIMETWFCLASIKDANQRKKVIKKVEEASLAKSKLNIARSWLNKINESAEV